MHVAFEIHGRFEVPDGTEQIDGSTNLFRLPSGQVVSVHPVIEMATAHDSDDHHDLTTAEAAEIGVHLDLYDRDSSLHAAE